jgi:hypothetical protein
MTIALWVILVHIVELVGIGVYLLIRKNNLLERTVVSQQQYLDAISIIIGESNTKLKELDALGAFQADDEVGTFFTNLKEIQDTLNQFNTRKN